MEVKNKVAIVTGGIGGIGFATVQCLLNNGAQYVALFDIVQQNDAAVLNNLNLLNQEFDKSKYGYYICDVTNANEFAGCYERVRNAQKYVDILINNAGIRNDDYIDLLIDTNFKAVVNCTMIAISNMGIHKGQQGGVIVNVASVTGLINLKSQPLYSATKHAVVAFVRSMKDHNKTLGIRILCVCPHKTATNMLKSLGPSKQFDFIDRKESENHNDDYIQRPESVALTIVEMIKEADEGEVWISQLDEPPFSLSAGDSLKKIAPIN